MGAPGCLPAGVDRGEAKKLIEAAGRLFHGCKDTDESREALAAANIHASPEQLAQLEEPALEVWLENWPALCLYLRLDTQWTFRAVPVGMGASVSLPSGLVYGRLEFWLELDEVPREQWRGAVDGLKVIEAEIVRLSMGRR